MAREIKLALISVSDKSGIADFVRGLHEMGVEIISTGGTKKAIAEAGIPVTDISEYTGFPGDDERPREDAAPERAWRAAGAAR